MPAAKRSSLSIDLSPDADLLVRKIVASGRFASASEAVHEGLRLLAACQGETRAKLRDDIEVGWRQSTKGQVVDGPAVFAEIRALSKARRNKSRGAK